MTHTQKLIAIALFGLVYGLVAYLVFREDRQARANFHTCPLCEK